ncbi:ABC transporter ATP-binding protein [Streptococcus sp. S784/96/1]|uniref:ABC transporter ATP-binding protein n=1 Tax=Streptococcus sp. S784/96/1 TaxID=2653499 RepID=UPI00138A1EEB|nr:ABC transporter ATP-binding protein [Streptococcus sp. S784/96/1]
MTKVIEVTNLNKTIKGKSVLTDLRFTLYQGDCVALIGPNGAGKTTLMSCLLGDYWTKAGQVTVLGFAPTDNILKEKIAVLFQDNVIESDLKVKEILTFQRAIYPNPLSEAAIDDLLGFSPAQKEQFADKLSGGQRRLLSFVKILIGQPDIIILDEPTAGMDTSTRKRFWEIVGELKKVGKTILYSSHYIEEVEHTAERILLLNQGKLIRDTTPYDLQWEDQEKCFSFPESYLASLTNCPFYDVAIKAGRATVMTKAPEQVLQALLEDNCPVSAIEMTNRSLLTTLFMKAGNNDDTTDSFA